MVDHATHVYPPLGDDTRYEAILTRGRVLRRRRRAGVGIAGAGGAMAAAALVVVLFAATGPSNGDPVVADQDDAATTTTTAPDVSSTATTARFATDELPVQVVVSDPVQPVTAAGGTPAQQCVLATLTDRSGAPVAEGFACRSAVQSAQAVVDVTLTVTGPGGTSIGCGAAVAVTSETATEPVATGTAPAESTFRVPTPEGLAAGTYTLRIDAVSGIGDGCGGSTEGSTEDEHQADPITAEVSVP